MPSTLLDFLIAVSEPETLEWFGRDPNAVADKFQLSAIERKAVLSKNDAWIRALARPRAAEESVAAISPFTQSDHEVVPYWSASEIESRWVDSEIASHWAFNYSQSEPSWFEAEGAQTA